jgi:hypothetical protein
MMKKYLVVFLSLVLVVGLAACTSSSTVNGGSSGTINTNYANAVSVQSQLAAGMLKLEGTASAVTKTQAVPLLMLWKAIRSLSANSATSQIEINAVMEQIQETLTAEQIKAIADLKLTQTNLTEVMQNASVSYSLNATPQASGTRQTTRVAVGSGGRPEGGGVPGGGMPGGGMPAGGGGVPGDGIGGVITTPNASTQSTAQARVAAQGSASPTGLINLVIAFLEKRANE